MAKTISFVKGKGSIAHNNRDFIAENVDRTRTEYNEYYKQESLEQAYEHCFGQALEDYNAKQTREDRKKGDYITEIKHSGNGEKLFYENVVQIGDKNDTGFFREDAPDLNDVYVAAEVLREYARTFQERNPNLYLFNSVLHMDEATPHLHLDYIPVAHGYKRGMETRNSLTKALQQMGIPKAVKRNRNETVFWQERERNYIKELCQERGIEIYEKGVKRENLSLPEYRDAMHQVEEMNNEVEEERKKLKEMAEKEAETQKRLEKFEIREDLIKKADAIVKDEKEKGKGPKAKTIYDLLGRDTGFVKVEKEDWKEIKRVYNKSKTKLKLMDSYEEKISGLSRSLKEKNSLIEKCKQFLEKNGFWEQFNNFLHPKRESLLAKLEKGYREQKQRERDREREPRILQRTVRKEEEISL